MTPPDYMHKNIEIKAVSHNAAAARDYLLKNHAIFKGTDIQTDTYFNVQYGRLKLREGNIENNLIFYDRNNMAGPKQADFILVQVEDRQGLKESLSRSLGIKVVVRKEREIYYIDNVKFHIDHVIGLGDFIEIEAGNILADKTTADLDLQCRNYMDALGIREEDLLEGSYSDMLL